MGRFEFLLGDDRLMLPWVAGTAVEDLTEVDAGVHDAASCREANSGGGLDFMIARALLQGPGGPG